MYLITSSCVCVCVSVVSLGIDYEIDRVCNNFVCLHIIITFLLRHIRSWVAIKCAIEALHYTNDYFNTCYIMSHSKEREHIEYILIKF